jgi:hypothetical protein
MANRWTHAGGAAWLDAVLCDGGLSEEDSVDDADPLRSQTPIADAERNVGNGDEPQPSPG